MLPQLPIERFAGGRVLDQDGIARPFSIQGNRAAHKVRVVVAGSINVQQVPLSLPEPPNRTDTKVRAQFSRECGIPTQNNVLKPGTLRPLLIGAEIPIGWPTATGRYWVLKVLRKEDGIAHFMAMRF